MSKTISPSAQKRLRNQEIYRDIACAIRKEEVCAKWNLSLVQLNRILREANEEAEEWFKSLPRKLMIQIFRFNSEKILQEIQKLEQIRDNINDPIKEFEMTKSIIGAYFQYTKMVAEGPSLIRQKEVTEQAEKAIGEK